MSDVYLILLYRLSWHVNKFAILYWLVPYEFVLPVRFVLIWICAEEWVLSKDEFGSGIFGGIGSCTWCDVLYGRVSFNVMRPCPYAVRSKASCMMKSGFLAWISPGEWPEEWVFPRAIQWQRPQEPWVIVYDELGNVGWNIGNSMLYGSFNFRLYAIQPRTLNFSSDSHCDFMHPV